jgi:hypothetical protein
MSPIQSIIFFENMIFACKDQDNGTTTSTILAKDSAMTFIRDSHGRMSQRSGSRNSSLPRRARGPRRPASLLTRAAEPERLRASFRYSIFTAVCFTASTTVRPVHISTHTHEEEVETARILCRSSSHPVRSSPRKATTQLQQNPQNADVSTQQQTQQPPGLRDLGCTPQLGAPIYAPAGSGTGRHL